MNILFSDFLKLNKYIDKNGTFDALNYWKDVYKSKSKYKQLSVFMLNLCVYRFSNADLESSISETTNIYTNKRTKLKIHTISDI